MEPIDVLRSGRRYCALTTAKINHPPSLNSTLGYRAALLKAHGTGASFMLETGPVDRHQAGGRNCELLLIKLIVILL